MTRPLVIDWGDGSPVTPVYSGEPATHEYADDGNYEITASGLRVSDSDTCEFTAGDPSPEGPCSVTGISPNKVKPTCYASGETITITGSGFTGATAVNYVSASSYIRCSTFTVVNDTTITATVDYVRPAVDQPMGVTDIPFTEVTVTGADGSVCGFTVNACLATT